MGACSSEELSVRGAAISRARIKRALARPVSQCYYWIGRCSAPFRGVVSVAAAHRPSFAAPQGRPSQPEAHLGRPRPAAVFQFRASQVVPENHRHSTLGTKSYSTSAAMSTGSKKKNIEKRREKSRNDARYRRRSEARIFTELCHILPLAKEPTFYHLDRIAVLRVAVAMCRLRAVTANVFRQGGHTPLLPGCARWYNEEDLSELLDGCVFLIVDLHSLIVYVSSSVVETIGMTQTDLIGRQLCDYVHPEDAAELQMVMQWCTVRGEERELVLRVRSALSPRGRSLSLKSSLYKTFSFTIKSTNNAVCGDRACKGVPLGANQHGFVYERGCWPHQSFSDACLLMFGRAIMHSGHAEGASSELVMTRHTMDMQIYYIDQRLEDLLGYDVKKFRGLSYYGLVHPEDMKMFSGSMRQLYAKGKSTTGYYRLMTRQGSVLWLLTEFAVITETTRGQRSQRIHCLHRMLMHVANDGSTYQRYRRPECLKDGSAIRGVSQAEGETTERKPIAIGTKESKPSAPVVTIYDAALPANLRATLAKKHSLMLPSNCGPTTNACDDAEPKSYVCSMHFAPFLDLVECDKYTSAASGAREYEMKKTNERYEEKDFSCLSQLSPFVNYEDLMELHNDGYNVQLCLQGQESASGHEWMAAPSTTATTTTTTTETETGAFGATPATIKQPPTVAPCALNGVLSTPWITQNDGIYSERQMVDDGSSPTTTTTTLGKCHSAWMSRQLREKTAPDVVASELISLETASLLESAMMTLFQTESLHGVQSSDDYR
uniref:PAS domain-containing protein n=1 Tax=Trichuris muris TaxID=70415 RepID=A0A5S6QZ03_TRIMR